MHKKTVAKGYGFFMLFLLNEPSKGNQEQFGHYL